MASKNLDYTALSALITEFRHQQAKDSITPESLGALLQKITDYIESRELVQGDTIVDGVANLLIPFDGFVSGDNVLTMSIAKNSTDSDATVKYNTTVNRFVLGVYQAPPTYPQNNGPQRIVGVDTTVWYNNWGDRDIYGTSDMYGCVPHLYKIFVDTSTSILYIFNDGVLVPLAGASAGSSSSVGSAINVRDYGAVGDGQTDDTAALQQCIDLAYEQHRKVRIPAGEYLVTRTLFVYDGIDIEGDGIYNTIIRTPFGKSAEAKNYVARDKSKSYSSLTGTQPPAFDLAVGHNRFYIGNGVVGYYDSDRHTNPQHPLYWPNDNSEEYRTWYSEMQTIKSQGRWIGATGREGYGGAVFKSSQQPGLRYEDYENKKVRPYGPIHTGIRNVRFAHLQINTNSTDRGKDSAIDFQYKATQIPSAIREKYDSSVLNIQLYNLYLFSLGKSGYRVTRAVDHTIIGCYVRQAAETGFYIDGVTSVFFTGCYCNSCTEGGYILRGCNYCALNSCASDSCSIGYKLYKCNGVTLVSCGAEATRYQKGEEGEEDPLKGRAFAIQNCNGVSLISPYTMTTHPKVYLDNVFEATDEDLDPNWNRTRHVFVSESQNVQIAYPYFKCFMRIRRAAYTESDGTKVNCLRGAYDGNSSQSRYWQVQNYLVGAQYEIRGEESSVHIIAGDRKEQLCKESEIRTNNLDILDLGLVPNPLVDQGLVTAGRTLSGEDGNGGWEYVKDGTVHRVTLENFEFVFPINAKTNYGNRYLFWKWRNSLVLVRKHTDDSLRQSFPGKQHGYVDLLSTPLSTTGHIDWSSVSTDILQRFAIHIIDDYDSSLIDGSKSLYSYGTFSWQQNDPPIAFEPSIFSPIPAFVRDKPEGHRVTINSNTIDGFPSAVTKASVSAIGFESKDSQTDEEIDKLGPAFVVLSRRHRRHMGDEATYKAMQVINMEGTDLFSVYEKTPDSKALSVGGRNIISTQGGDYSYIPKPATTASNEVLASTLGLIIDRLTAHGLMVEPDTSVNFRAIEVAGGESEATISFLIDTDVTIYAVGIAYSNTNTAPVYGNNHSSATNFGSTYYVTLTYGTNRRRYFRLYIETNAQGGESSRVYSPAYELTCPEGSSDAVITPV